MLRRAAFVLMTILVVAGCDTTTSSPAVRPSGSPVAAATAAQPSITPTAPPVDVAQAFLPKLLAISDAKLSLRGTFEFGEATGTVTGETTFVGPDVDQRMTIAVGATTSTTETIHASGTGYTKSGDGPWLQDATAPAAGKDLSSVLRSIAGLTDAGTETRAGVLVHKLVAPSTTVIDPAALGLTDPAYKSPVVELVFYAKPDGAPFSIVMTATWTQASGGADVPVTLEIEMTFIEVGAHHRVVPPSDVWLRFGSKRFHYSMARPGDWDVDVSGKTLDFYQSPGDAYVGATRISAQGFGLNAIAKGEIAYEKRHGLTFNSNVAFSLDGRKARLLTFHGKVGGRSYVIYEVLAVNGKYVYDVTWGSPKGHEAADLAQFEEMLGTFKMLA